jgi:succinate dehydrogenase / fumarate reductase flavoprotein subunit
MIYDISCKYFDVLIIGAGGAGLMSAVSACDNNLKNIAIISKVLPTNSHTVSAKGGINASLGNVIKDDWKWHAFDTIKGSDFLADEDAVEILCKNACDAIIYLEKNGVVFSRDENNKIAQRAYGGQSTDFGKGEIAHRACYSKDNTGQTILHTLYQQALKNNINFFNEYFVIDLLVENNQCFGCLAVDLNNGELIIFSSKIVILATGGYSQIYHNTTSSTICTGDGTALAFKAGIDLQDMEFVQFHPTGIYGSGFLVTEATRGEGGYLLNKNHHRFMQDYAPKMMELASRDVIAQSMAKEIFKGNGAGENSDYLYLDLRHLSQETLRNKIPGAVDLIEKFLKLDVKKDLIPIAPSAHYSMGGVACDVDCNVIAGLMAVGEVACHSVHGANRLGCNSLLDLIVFGKIAGENASKNVQLNQKNSAEIAKISQKIAQQKIVNFNQKFVSDKNSNEIKNQQPLSEIKKLMQKNNEKTLGVFRNHDLILEGINFNKELLKKLNNYKILTKNLFWNEELILYLELENLLLNAVAVGFCALNRKESRGSHYRSDNLGHDDKNFFGHSLVRLKNFDEIIMEFNLKPVKNTNKFLSQSQFT